MNIDILMNITSVVVGMLIPILTRVIQKKLDKKYIKFSNLESNYLTSIADYRIKSCNFTDDEIDIVIKELKKTYEKMLQESKEGNEDVRIVIRKYIENREQLVYVYSLPHNILVTDVLGSNTMQLKNQLANLYLNGSTPFQKKFVQKSAFPRWQSYISHTLKEEGRIIGTISIASTRMINERYGYENIKALIVPIERILVPYIKEKDVESCTIK